MTLTEDEQRVRALRAWITQMREREDWPETDLGLMDAIEATLDEREQLALLVDFIRLWAKHPDEAEAILQIRSALRERELAS